MTILSHRGVEAFASVAGGTTTVGLTATYTGLCVSNPAGSGVYLYIDNVSGGFNVASTAITSIGLIVGYAVGGVTAHTTPAIVYDKTTLVTSTVALGLADAACTLVGTPIWADWLAFLATASTVGSYFSKDIDGALIIPPGGYIAIGTSVVSGTN